MLSKKYIPALLLGLALTLAGCLAAFADETVEEFPAGAAEETEGETVIVSAGAAKEDGAGETTGETASQATAESTDDTDGSSSMILSNNVMEIFEQSEADEQSGPDFLNALIGQASADPDAEGIASAVIGRWENREVDIASAPEPTDTDAFMEYYMALLAMLNETQAGTNEVGPGVSNSASSDTSLASNPPVTDAEGRELIPLGRFAVTKYCPCSICCGSSGGRTASGKQARSNHTIAADTRLYPFGTQLMVNGIIYTVEDTGGNVRGNTIDIFVDSHSEAVSYGTHYADVYLVR